MSWALEPIEINQDDLVVRTYAREDKTAIAQALLDPEGWFGRNWGLNTIEKIEEMVERNSGNRALMTPWCIYGKGLWRASRTTCGSKRETRP